MESENIDEMLLDVKFDDILTGLEPEEQSFARNNDVKHMAMVREVINNNEYTLYDKIASVKHFISELRMENDDDKDADEDEKENFFDPNAVVDDDVDKKKRDDWVDSYKQYKKRDEKCCLAGVAVKVEESRIRYIRQCKRKPEGETVFCKQHNCVDDKFIYNVEMNDGIFVHPYIPKVADGEGEPEKPPSIRDIFSVAEIAARRAKTRLGKNTAAEINLLREAVNQKKLKSKDNMKQRMEIYASSLAKQFDNLKCNVPNVDDVYEPDDSDSDDTCDTDTDEPMPPNEKNNREISSNEKNNRNNKKKKKNKGRKKRKLVRRT
jgi:hypothetical protein